MNKKKIYVKEEEFDIALDGRDGHMTFYLDLETGEIQFVSDDMEIDDEQIPNWLRAIKENPKRFYEVPPIPSSLSFDFMKSFAEDEVSGNVQEILLEALSGKRPFRRFKDALFEFPEVEKAWYVYERVWRCWHMKRWLHVESLNAELVFNPNLPNPDD
jgi:hypothetical protein